MNVENIIAAQRAYKHCLTSWNREVIIAACEVAFRDAILNAESVCKELIGAK